MYIGFICVFVITTIITRKHKLQNKRPIKWYLYKKMQYKYLNCTQTHSKTKTHNFK